MAFSDWTVTLKLEKAPNSGNLIGVFLYQSGTVQVQDRITFTGSATDQTIAATAQARILELDSLQQVPAKLRTGNITPAAPVAVPDPGPVPAPVLSPLQVFQQAFGILQSWNRLLAMGVIKVDDPGLASALANAQKAFDPLFGGQV